MSFNSKLDEIKIKLWKTNIDEIMKESLKIPLPKTIDLKIKSEIKSKGFEYNDVLLKIQTDKLYASHFAKNPIKQNIAEILQMNLLKQHIPNIKKLNNDTEYLMDGLILSGTKSYCQKTPTKNFDFFDDKSRTYYYAKYINDRGGSQDNQYNDCVNFLNQVNMYYDKAIKPINKKTVISFVLLIDGDYFNDKKKIQLNQIINKKYKNYIKITSSLLL